MRNFNTYSSMLFLVVLLVVIPKVLASEESEKSIPASSPVPSSSQLPQANQGTGTDSKRIIQSDLCLANQTIVDDIRRMRDENETRKKELQAKEEELKAREKAIDELFGKLNKVKEDIALQTESNQKEVDEKVGKLVETFTTMSPKGAAKVLAGLSDGLAVRVISQMETARLGKIMNALDPVKAAKLAELLTGFQNRKKEQEVAQELTEKGGSQNVQISSARTGVEQSKPNVRQPNERTP